MDTRTSRILSPASIIRDHGVWLLETLPDTRNIIIDREIPLIVTKFKVKIYYIENECKIDMFVLTEGSQSYVSLTCLRRFAEKMDPTVSKNNKFVETDEPRRYTLGNSPGHKKVQELHNIFGDRKHGRPRANFIKFDDIVSCTMMNDILVPLNIEISSGTILECIEEHFSDSMDCVLSGNGDRCDNISVCAEPVCSAPNINIDVMLLEMVANGKITPTLCLSILKSISEASKVQELESTTKCLKEELSSLKIDLAREKAYKECYEQEIKSIKIFDEKLADDLRDRIAHLVESR